LKLATPPVTGLQTALMSDAQSRMTEFARALRQARTLRKLSVEHVSRECLLSDKQILGLETADLRPFYSPTYAARGAERYAKFLGVVSIPRDCIARLGASPEAADAEATHDRDPRSGHWTARLKHWVHPLRSPRRPHSSDSDR